MVRRAVASNVGHFAGVVEGHLLLNDVVPVFEALASDDQDNVRLLAVEQSGKVAKALVDQVGNSYCTIQYVSASTVCSLDSYLVLSIVPTAELF